jgi:hypothetical protein
LKMYSTEITDARITEFVSGVLGSQWPTAWELLGEMKLTYLVRDFTFETLDSEDFLKRLQKMFPERNWDKAFQAANAVVAKPE